MNPARLSAVAATALLATATLTGCSTSVDDASTDYCENLDTLRGELTSLRALVSTDATVEEVADQRSAVLSAYEDTTAAAEDLDAAVRDAASGAYSSFEDSVGGISTDLPLSEAAGEYTGASDAFLAELGSIADEAGCS
jgi:hypothetical protein